MVDSAIALSRLFFVAEKNNIVPPIKTAYAVDLYDAGDKKLGSIPFAPDKLGELFEVSYLRKGQLVGWQPSETFFIKNATWPNMATSSALNCKVYLESSLRRWAEAVFTSSKPFVFPLDFELVFPTSEQYLKKTGIQQIIYKVSRRSPLEEKFVPRWEQK